MSSFVVVLSFSGNWPKDHPFSAFLGNRNMLNVEAGGLNVAGDQRWGNTGQGQGQFPRQGIADATRLG